MPNPLLEPALKKECDTAAREAKRPCRGETLRAPLENDLQRELRVERFSRPDSWSVVAGADGGADLAEAAAAGVGIAELGWSRAGEIEAIGYVEHLHAELGVERARPSGPQNRLARFISGPLIRTDKGKARQPTPTTR